MTDKDYTELHEFVMEGAGWVPNNENAIELMEQTSPGEVQMFKEVTDRDIKFMGCYFKLLKYIWEYMPDRFKRKVPSGSFYMWLKHLRKDYTVVFEFADDTKYIEYKSISFGRMSQFQFETYVREQLPFIYESVIGLAYSGDEYDNVLYNIEDEFKIFLGNL